ncbi:MAG: hypothetical protein LBE27_05165 [Deltaproteobacteria bacterium]|jgi:cell division septation protein DedD|nr:hypothetical protein [Deltaproteobacteria bacterium]
MTTQLLYTSDKLTDPPDKVDSVQTIGMYSQVVGYLDALLGKGFSKILAEPVEKLGSNSVKWYTSVEGKPTPFESLTQADKNSVRASLAFSAKHFLQVGSACSATENEKQRIVGLIFMKLAQSVAESVTGAPSSIKVFVVGDTPVICGWGLQNIGEKSLTDSQQNAAAHILASGLMPPGYQILTDPNASEQVASSAKDPQKEPTFWNLLRTFLAALLTLLVFTLLLFLFVPKLKDLFFLKLPKIDQSTEAGLVEEIYILKTHYLDSLSSCLTQEAELRLEPLPKTREEEQLQGEENQSLYSVRAPDPPPPEPEKVAPKTTTTPKAPTPAKPKAQAPAKATPKKGQGFAIPPGGDPNDLSFLEGCWESASNLVSSYSKMPVVYVYCFNSKGSGTATVKEYDKSGRQTDTCTASTSASRKGNTVTIRDTGARCKRSPQYSKNTLTCNNGPNNSTSCLGKNQGRGFKSQFKYLGRS